jgi:hypothetical protein
LAYAIVHNSHRPKSLQRSRLEFLQAGRQAGSQRAGRTLGSGDWLRRVVCGRVTVAGPVRGTTALSGTEGERLIVATSCAWGWSHTTTTTTASRSMRLSHACDAAKRGMAQASLG